MRMILPAALLLLASAAAAQPPSDGGRRGFGRFRGSVFLSPMGEPFRSEASDAANEAAWFRQADKDGDGTLTADEMRADAARFFAILDANHDGELDPDEVARYENEVAPEVQVGLQMGGGGRGGGGRGGMGRGGGGGGGRRGGMGGGGRGGMGGGRGGGGGEGGQNPGQNGQFEPGLEGAGRFSLLNIPEPVISADVDLNRGVSRQEFANAAGQRFLLLDTTHRGRIALAELPPLPQRHAGKFKKRKGDPRPINQGRQGIGTDP
jgi:Ca2+-binding EF-hand superfamily protein